MSTGSIICMVSIVAIVLGGFLYFLMQAMKKEKTKNG